MYFNLYVNRHPTYSIPYLYCKMQEWGRENTNE